MAQAVAQCHQIAPVPRKSFYLEINFYGTQVTQFFKSDFRGLPRYWKPETGNLFSFSPCHLLTDQRKLAATLPRNGSILFGSAN